MRYEKQVLFKEIGKQGQKRLAKARVAIIGLGGLGSTVAELLTRAGIGTLLLFDHDAIDISNLQRQSLYNEADIGRLKSEAAKEKLDRINSDIDIQANSWIVSENNIKKIKADLIIDCTDNLETRFVINEHCKKTNTPWIYAAVAGAEGFVFIITKGRPCLRCILKKTTRALTCKDVGIINPLPHAIASIQAAEALKILLKKEYCKDLIYIDMWNNDYKRIKVSKDKNCPICKK